jgi:hypothetical protein
MTRTTQGAQTATIEATTAEVPTNATRTRRGRGRRRLGYLRPVYPIRALWEAASEEERRQAHARCATLLEYWLGAASKQEVAQRLSVPTIRVWQMSQRAAAAMVCGLLKPPSGKRGRPTMTQGEGGKDLAKENARLAKENALLRDLVSVLRQMPGNKDREIPAPLAEADAGTPKEAEATKPRKKKSKPERRSVPGAAAVDSPPAP